MTDHWGTPQAFYDKLDKEFNFDMDPCPLHSKFDGLIKDWKGQTVFMNPPYSHVARWLMKAVEECNKGSTVVCLLPANRTDQTWFHKYCLQEFAEIRYVRGRINFVNPERKAASRSNHASMVVIFRPQRCTITMTGCDGEYNLTKPRGGRSRKIDDMGIFTEIKGEWWFSSSRVGLYDPSDMEEIIKIQKGLNNQNRVDHE